MIHIKSPQEGAALFKALGSDIRIAIVEILLDEPDMSMNELATRLDITAGALTGHVKKLEECGVLKVSVEGTGHGNVKRCSVALDKILIDLQPKNMKKNTWQISLKVGQFSECEVWPTCGMASKDGLIGELDDVRYFSHPARFAADILWFGRGFVEYMVPCFIPVGSRIDCLTISVELSSEAPGVNEVWPSDISFSINSVHLGKWTSPGDFGNQRGRLNPEWWHDGLNQYGFLKMLMVNREGTFIDGRKLSDVNLDALALDDRKGFRLRFAAEGDSDHVGGMTLFGRSFGNYDQDIEVRMDYG
ncbi:MAG TPA: winged helix-turn-helix transcriptional regulator [Candidatus Eisenbergiella merdipullorum]|uniref:Winged helix-turn-helix transcriptional regulator n=1 Tax=Candidatus Eisenbergiella merdipullorum TaxID=2838553 RepID=A0A9D2I5A1_9FIRM|nr:winged helix-turn-helix transcriptional regulator [Candidatus Eisenbergiella merdipullorum]